MQIFLKRWQVPSSLDRIIRKKILAGGFTHGAYKDKESYSYIKRTGWAILLVSMILAGGIRAQDTFSSRDPKVYAWWGTIYPEFCFEKVEDNGENKPVKISFWLAKALDW